jgi:hypothetical protein
MIQNLDDLATSKFETTDRSRRWFFTCNNPTEEDINNFKDARQNGTIKWLCVYKEIGEEGTPHLQGGLILEKNSYYLSWMKQNINSRTHWMIMKGNQQQIIDYCTKDYQKGKNNSELIYDDGLEFKEDTKTKRKRLHQEIRDHKTTLKDIYEEDPDFYATHARAFKDSYQQANYYVKRKKPEVIWIYGKSGSGKTEWAYNYFNDDCDSLELDNGFYDGLTDNPNLFYDEIDPQQQNIKKLLKMLGQRPVRLNIKGGSHNFKPEKICIASYLDPMEYIKTFPNEPPKALLRRIDRIIHCTYEETTDTFKAEDMTKDYFYSSQYQNTQTSYNNNNNNNCFNDQESYLTSNKRFKFD